MPALGVCLFIQNDQGKIVLTKRNDLPVWCLPGGAVEAGESLVEAAVREAKEETGLEVQVTRLVGLYSRPNWFDGTHDVVFAAQPVGGELQTDGVETVDIGFFDPADLPQPLLPWHYDHIADAALKQNPVTVRRQDIAVPLNGVSRKDFHELRAQNKLPVHHELLAALCKPIPAEKDRIELPL